jgi:hypothetical protein
MVNNLIQKIGKFPVECLVCITAGAQLFRHFSYAAKHSWLLVVAGGGVGLKIQNDRWISRVYSMGGNGGETR